MCDEKRTGIIFPQLERAYRPTRRGRHQPRRTTARELPPQLTHLALISAAFNLDRALGA